MMLNLYNRDKTNLCRNKLNAFSSEMHFLREPFQCLFNLAHLWHEILRLELRLD